MLRAVGPLAVLVLAQVAVNWWFMAAATRGIASRAGWVEFSNLVVLLLVAMCLSLGPLPLVRQVVLAPLAVGLLLTSAIIVSADWLWIRDQWISLVLIRLGAVASVSGLSAYFRVVRGWRLAPRDWPYPIPPGRPLRFSLRQMFIGTALVAVLFAIRGSQQLLFNTVSGLLMGLFSMLILVPTMVLLIGSPRRRMGTLFDAVLLALGGGLLVWGLAYDGTGGLWPTLVWYGSVAGGLLWLRLCGIRLVRGT